MRRIWEILEPAQAGDRASRVVDVSIGSLILANVAAVIFGSVEAVRVATGEALDLLETVSLSIFSIEYVARLMTCTVDERFPGAIRGRLRWALSPMAVIDLLAIAPLLAPLLGLDLRFVRLFRLFRLVKLTRYVRAFRVIGYVARQKREELLVTTVLMLFLLVVSSCLMYFVENGAQPDAYPDIPTTMWWAVATMTTVGYGDVYPTTAVGRLLGAVVAICGIGFFALPTGILGAGFVDALQVQRQDRDRCPHCGGNLQE